MNPKCSVNQPPVTRNNAGVIQYDEFRKGVQSLVPIKDRDMDRLIDMADLNKDGVIDYNEFNKALTLLEEQVANDTIGQLGLSQGALMAAFSLGLTILVLLFSFIFFGIAAFTENSAFGAVINSLLPLTSGGGLAAKSDAGDKEEKSSQVSGTIEDALSRISAEGSSDGKAAFK